MRGSRSTSLRVVSRPPSQVGFDRLVADPASFAVMRIPALRWLDTRGWTLSCSAPFLTLSPSSGRTVVRCESGWFAHAGDPLELIDRLLERLRPRRSCGLPFEGGLVGFLGYELLDHSDWPRTERPDAWLAFPRQVRITPDSGDEVEVRLDDLPAPGPLLRELGCEEVDAAGTQLWGRSGHITAARGNPRAEFVAAVEECQRLIAAGDLYQANLSHQLEIEACPDARALAIASWRLHPAPHQAYLDCGDFQVVGASPELFLRRRGHHITVRPIKGTRPRGKSPSEDSRMRDDLAADTKEAAEHVMIVDLERSDLGRIARSGSVAVAQFMAVETFGTVHHLVSTVIAECRPGATVGEILRATFPCGSVTGAPKIRAREVIRDLERAPRGIYTGATGFIDCRGDLELAVAIRTAVVEAGFVRYGVGAGIVADSVADKEWNETLLKSAALRAALDDIGSAARHHAGPATLGPEESAT